MTNSHEVFQNILWSTTQNTSPCHYSKPNFTTYQRNNQTICNGLLW